MNNQQSISEISIDALMAAEVHPLANLLPMGTKAEINAIAFSIRDLGFREDKPIIFHHGKILDGRNRRKAVERLNKMAEVKQPIFIAEFDDNGISAADFVLSNNVARRHLSPSQLAMVADDFSNVRLGDNQYSKDWNSKFTEKSLAKKFNISPRQIRYAKQVKNFGDEVLVRAVREGNRTMHSVIREIGLRTKVDCRDAPNWLDGGLLSAKRIGTRTIGALRFGEVDALIELLQADITQLEKVKAFGQVDDQLVLVSDIVPKSFGVVQ